MNPGLEGHAGGMGDIKNNAAITTAACPRSFRQW